MKGELGETAARMVAPGKGILAADESTPTIAGRFEQIGLESTEETRRDYREILFRTGPAMRECISGVILYEETLGQNAADGTPLVSLITAAGALPGIKVDKGAKPLAGSPGEKVTEGLDGLRERFAGYRDQGARFAKWRAVIEIAEGRPSRACIRANAHALARYAALAQEAAIVPIVEPEVLMDGPVATHSIEDCRKVTEWTLNTVFEELAEANVALEGIVLKPNMVIAGQNAPEQARPHEVAEQTLACLRATVPAAVPGIAFLSGGQSDEQASQHLSLINQLGGAPWTLTFSYGRALQQAALKAWGGKAENVPAARRAFGHRARMNSLAARGDWRPEIDEAA